MPKEMNNNEKIELLKQSEISLSIDSYDDIFSDFDPRPFSQRALSVDFLDEAKRASRDKEEIELKFLMPSILRNFETEKTIKNRLREHFKKHAKETEAECKQTIILGIRFIIAGIIFMFLATLILYKFKEASFLSTFLVVLLEPAGWFSFWEGLNLAIFESKKKKPEAIFYKKMANCKITFLSY